MKFEKIESKQEIYQTLMSFNYCFPHLTEKINNLEEYSEKLYRYSNFYVLKIEGDVVGMVSFYSNDLTDFRGYISLIGVHQKYQKMGLGRILIESTSEVMKKHLMRYVRIEVDKDNRKAQAFYSHLGFVEAESKEDSFYMEKAL